MGYTQVQTEALQPNTVCVCVFMLGASVENWQLFFFFPTLKNIFVGKTDSFYRSFFKSN